MCLWERKYSLKQTQSAPYKVVLEPQKCLLCVKKKEREIGLRPQRGLRARPWPRTWIEGKAEAQPILQGYNYRGGGGPQPCCAIRQRDFRNSAGRKSCRAGGPQMLEAWKLKLNPQERGINSGRSAIHLTTSPYGGIVRPEEKSSLQEWTL